MINYLLLFLFPLGMAYAASSDLLTMRISNKVVLALFISFFPVALAMGMPVQQIGLHIAAAVAVLGVAFGLFAMGWVGGGDAKLAAVTGLWLGFGLTLPYLIYASLFGGGLTLAILMLRKWPLPAKLTQIAWISRLHHHKTGIPYGIALAASGLLIYSDTAVYQYLTG